MKNETNLLAGSALIAIIVVNFRNPEDTLGCVDSLLQSNYDRIVILIVDNSDDKNLREKIENKSAKCRYIKTESNLGYSGGNNVGIDIAISMGADFVFVLNNDTTVENDTISRLCETFLHTRKRIGALYPKTFNTSLPAQPPSAGGGLKWNGSTHHILDDGQLPFDEEGLYGPLDWVPGAAIFFSKDALLNVGKFNPGLFLYYEDVEWSMRATKKGYLLYYCPSAVVNHQSEKAINNSGSAVRAYYPFRNHIAVAKMTFGREMTFFVLFQKIFFNFPVLMFADILRGQFDVISVRIDALIDGLFLNIYPRFLPE